MGTNYQSFKNVIISIRSPLSLLVFRVVKFKYVIHLLNYKI